MTVHYSASTELKDHHPDPATQHRPVVPTNEARQGVTGHNVRYVLGISVTAVVAVFGAVWLYYFA